MRNISASLTTEQIRESVRRVARGWPPVKDVTRRLGWRTVKAGERLQVGQKCMGRRGEIRLIGPLNEGWNVAIQISRTGIHLRKIYVFPGLECWGFSPADDPEAIDFDGGIALIKAEPLVKLAVIEVVSARRERLDAMLDGDAYGISETIREGFEFVPQVMGLPLAFVNFFCATHKGCTPETEVTRIEFKYIIDHEASASRNDPPGFRQDFL